MTPLSRRLTTVSSPLYARTLKANPLRRKVRRLRVTCIGEGSEGLVTNPKFSRRDIQRICTQGPTFDDLKQYHSVVRKEGMGKTVEEKIAFVRGESLGGETYASEPKWNEMKEIPFMELYKGIEQRNWRSEFYDKDSTPWMISFFEDCGRLFRPSFKGFRAVIYEEGKEPVWCNCIRPGVDAYEEDYLFHREPEAQQPMYRTADLGYPSDYGYLQLFHRLGIAYAQQMPPSEFRRYSQRGYLKTKRLDQLVTPAEGLIDVSFHLTDSEITLHNLWYTLPRVGLIVFALSFLGICLAIGIFKPRKQMPADPMQAMEFAQSKGRARKDGRTGILFEDIAGLDNIIEDLKELVEFLKEPTKYQTLNAKPPKGVLLEGPPGTGKTLIAKAIAGEAGVPFYQMSGSEFVEAIVGVGAARVRDLFKRARAQGEACIIFVDEIDALGGKRAEAGILTNEEREQTLNQLLTEMDGFSSEMGVVFVGATNRADLLDPALQRPGRFDRKVRVVRPDTEGRHQILKIHAQRYRLAQEVDLLQLARDLPGLAGAELANVLNEASLEAIRRDGDLITSKDIYNAVDRVLQGIKHPVQPCELELGRMFAVHEMGRAIIANVLRERHQRLEAVEKVSIIARGRDKTRTVFFRGKDEDYTMTTRNRMLDRICVILAGRAAEQHIYGGPTTYSAKDLGPAFRLAEKIVANYALSDLGITSYASVVHSSSVGKHSFEVNVDNIDEDLFGRGLQGGMFQASDATLHKTLTKCYELMWDAYEKSLDIIGSYSNALQTGSKILLEKLELTGDEVQTIVRQYPPKPLKKPVMGDIDQVYAPQVPSPLSIKFDTEESIEAPIEVSNQRQVEKETAVNV